MPTFFSHRGVKSDSFFLSCLGIYAYAILKVWLIYAYRNLSNNSKKQNNKQLEISNPPKWDFLNTLLGLFEYFFSSKVGLFEY